MQPTDASSDALMTAIAATRTRAVGAGLDPDEYEAVTGTLVDLTDWPPAFVKTGAGYLTRAATSARAGHRASAWEAYLTGALWFHYATCVPSSDRPGHERAAAQAADAYRLALGQLDGSAEWIAGDRPGSEFRAVLRFPAGVRRPRVVLIIAGLDSSKEEFHYLAQALLDRGVATVAFDGPGQGELATSTVIQPRYETVTSAVIEALAHRSDLDTSAVAAVALSLGGIYGVQAATHDQRIIALATVSGLSQLDDETLPELLAQTLAQRAGGTQAAQRFADKADAGAIAPTLTQPLLVVAGGRDVIPTPAQATQIALAAPRGELLLIPEGDHLLANTQPQWLPRTADWLVTHAAHPTTMEA